MLKRLRSRLATTSGSSGRLRIYYASDIHGSEVCWRKFLNAGSFYDADVLIMGGDIVGKAVVPIEMASGSRATATLHGKTMVLDSSQAIAAFEASTRAAGIYPCRVDAAELAEVNQNAAARLQLFQRVVTAELERWLAIAVDKLDPDRRILVMCGNDDPWFVDEQLKTARAITFCDEGIIGVDGYEFLNLSYSNRTPWDSPRELDEDDLLARIRELARPLSDPMHSIFNLHVPPFNSGLDNAPRLDATLKPVTHMGSIEFVPVGSTAVRQAIEEFQPLLSLHGHVHESRGISRVGSTLAINPGSAYDAGRIDGAVVDLGDGVIQSYQLVSG